MIQFKQNLPRRYFYFILCCLFGINTAFAVKPVNDPAQKAPTINLEALTDVPLSDQTKESGEKLSLKEKIYLKILQRKIKNSSGEMLMDTTSANTLLISHLTNQRAPRIAISGQTIKIRTKGGKRYVGFLKIIDNEHISVGDQIFALEDVLSIQLKKSRRKTTGFIMIITGIVLFLLSALGLTYTNWDTQRNRVGYFFLLILISLISLLIGILNLLFKKTFTRHSWNFEILEKKEID